MIHPFSIVYMTFITPPKGLFKSFVLGWQLVLTGRTAYREDHQLVLKDRAYG